MKRWTIKKHDQAAVKNLANALDVSPIAAALLISRGYEDAESAGKFLNPQISDLYDPQLLKGMDAAVKRILKAIDGGEKILVWGDYDVDGTTGTVVLRKALEILGAETGFHIPHRFTEGYGLNVEHLAAAKERGYSLVVTVDTGTRSFEPLAWAKENGLDVVVTDHHLSDDSRGNPECVAMINPNQSGCDYPDKNLAGVGVAFKLAHALLRARGKEKMVAGFLKIVAIGTIADMMDLTGENRAIVTVGLKDLPKAHNFGLRALMEVADCNNQMTSFDIGFRIAPRINAAGRMDEARTVVNLFEADSFEKAREFAEVLDARNRERRKVQIEITDRAIVELLENGGIVKYPHVAVVSGEDWHRGVIGLAASKIVDKIYRPAIVISLENGVGHGSARSIADYHLLDGLDACSELFEQFGGHAGAAGMRIKRENIDRLREKLNEHAALHLSPEQFIPELKIDALVSSASLNLDLIDSLKRLEPFGIGNPKPVFATRDLELTTDPFVMKEKHLKLKLRDDKSKQFEAVWWDGVDKSRGQTLQRNSRIELAYTPEANSWNGTTRLQLKVEDLKMM